MAVRQAHSRRGAALPSLVGFAHLLSTSYCLRHVCWCKRADSTPYKIRCLEREVYVCPGVGPGIERFRPRRGKLEISKNMVVENLANVLDLPPETLEAVAGTPAADAAADAAAARTTWRPWTTKETDAGERAPRGS